MSTNLPFYLNAPNLSLATSIFTDDGLTIFAPNGFYSDGTISREQIAGILSAPQACPSCAPPCGSTIEASGNRGVYEMDINVGTAIGAIVIKFDPYNVPDGIMATYNGINYNKLSSEVYGYRASAMPNTLTYLGRTGNDCGLGGNSFSLDQYVFDGVSFNPTGDFQLIAIDPTQVRTNDNAPSWCYMVIPKPTVSPSTLHIKIVGACVDTAFRIEIACPVLLPTFFASARYTTELHACDTTVNDLPWYHVPIAISAGFVGINDLVFKDNKGINKMDVGWYQLPHTPPDELIHVSLEGIVDEVTTCSLMKIT